MPELPEVETIRRQLAPLVEGRRLERDRDPRPALVAPARAAGARPSARGSACGAAGPARQVPGVELRRRRAPGPAPAHDRRGARVIPSPSRRTPACASSWGLCARDGPRPPTVLPARREGQQSPSGRQASSAGDRRPAPVRHRRAAARAATRWRRSSHARLGPRAVRRALHRRAPARARARRARADQGAAARPAQDRGRRQHLRRRGAVPRGRAPAAPGRAADRVSSTRGCARR